MKPSTSKGSLPKGWIVKESKSQKGKIYFCHPERKIALWTLPEVLAFESGLKQETKPKGKTPGKLKPLTDGDAKAKKSSSPGESSTKSSPRASSAKPTRLQPHDIPIRMIFKAARKLPKSQKRSSVSDYVSQAFRPAGSTTAEKRAADAAAGSESAGKRCRASEDRTESAASSAGARRPRWDGESSQADGQGTKSSNVAHSEDTGSGTPNVKNWSGMVPGQLLRKRAKTSDTKSNSKAREAAEESTIKAKLAALKAKIQARVRSFPSLSTSSAANVLSPEDRPRMGTPSGAAEQRCPASASTAKRSATADGPGVVGRPRPAPSRAAQPHQPGSAAPSKKRRTRPQKAGRAAPQKQPPAAEALPAQTADRSAESGSRAGLTLPVPPAWVIPRMSAPARAGRDAAAPACPPTGLQKRSQDCAPTPSPTPEDADELMEWDGPEMNEEEVLSQIACLRDRSDHSTAPDSRWASPPINGVPQPTCIPGNGSQDLASLPGNRTHNFSSLSGSRGQGLASVLESGVHQKIPMPRGEGRQPLTIVIDTNVLISSVGFVHDIRDSFVEGVRPLLLIPWVVVQELDKLKQADRPTASQQTDVAQRARAATNFLLECFQARHPGVRGQTTQEAAAARTPLEARVADDAIFECCLAARAGRTLLLSDDKNLRTKVLLHGLGSVSRRQLLADMDRQEIAENVPVTEDFLFCAAKIVLRKVLSYVIRREMALVYGDVWQSMAGVRRPWSSLRDLVSCARSYLKTVFQPVFEGWGRWQHVFSLTTRPVLAEEERRCLPGRVAELLVRLRPTDHYRPLVAPLAAALRADAPPPADLLTGLGPAFGPAPVDSSGVGRPLARSVATGQSPAGSVSAVQSPASSVFAVQSPAGSVSVVQSAASSVSVVQSPASSVFAVQSPAAACDVRLLPDSDCDVRTPASSDRTVEPTASNCGPPPNRHRTPLGRHRTPPDHDWTPPNRVRTPPDHDWTPSDRDRTRPSLDDDKLMCADTLEPEPRSSVMLDVFQNVWSYINTCCGVLIDAAKVQHQYQYERPATMPSPEQCAAFLPELGSAIQNLALVLQSLMKVSVVALQLDGDELRAACDGLLALLRLAGQEAALTPSLLYRFIRTPSNRLLLGKGLEQLIEFLHSLEKLQRLVS